MPEEALLNPPTAPGETTPEANQFNSLKDMLADVDARTNPAPKAPEPDKPVEPKPPAPQADVPKPEGKPEAKTTPEADPTDADVEKILKGNTKAWRVYEGAKKNWSKRETELTTKIKALEEKPREAPGDAAKLAALEKQLEEERGHTRTWKEKTAQADYTKSEDYEKRFATPYKREFATAMDEVKQLKVKFTNRDGEESERPGTEADFQKALALPPGEQDEFIHQTFGSAAWRVINRISELHRINRASIEATQEHASKYDAQQQELQGKTKKEAEEYDNYFKSALDGVKQHPEMGKYFSDYADDPEATQLLNQAYEEIDSFASKASELPPDQRAAHAAVYRAQAAGFLPLLRQHKRVLTEVQELKTELSKYRKTDPGAKVKPDGEAIVPQDSWGIREAAQSMDAVP